MLFSAHTVESRIARDLVYSARKIVAYIVRIIRDRSCRKSKHVSCSSVDFKLAYIATTRHGNLCEL